MYASRGLRLGKAGADKLKIFQKATQRYSPHFGSRPYIQSHIGAYIRHYIEQNVKEGKNATVAEAEVIAQIKDSAIEKEMGTLQHALI